MYCKKKLSNILSEIVNKIISFCVKVDSFSENEQKSLQYRFNNVLKCRHEFLIFLRPVIGDYTLDKLKYLRATFIFDGSVNEQLEAAC